jgi:ABC-type branched-subunit amino acid transport system ATPase component/predicted MFS family arabinose efflux permease
LAPRDRGSEPASGDAAALATAVLDEEARRQEAHARRPDTVLPDDLLPGVGGKAMSLREGIQRGGVAMLVVLGLASIVEQVNLTGFAVIAPNIQQSLGVDDAVIAAIGASFGILFLAGSIPVSTLADRHRRTMVASVSIAIWSVIIFLTGFVQNAFQLFLARMGSGLGQSYQLPVNTPLLIDTYPIEARGRVFAAYFSMEVTGRALAPLIAGGIAGAFAGDESWRWVFWIVAVAAIPISVLTARLPEPRRGRNEMQAVLGEEVVIADELPVSLSVAFERLRKIKTFYFFLLGMAALGFALFTVPLFLNLILEDEFGLGALERGLVGSAVVLPGLVFLAIVGPRIDRLFRASPPRSLVFIGALIAGFGVFIVIAVLMPTVGLLVVFYAIGAGMAQAAFAVFTAPIGSVIPYRLRSRGVAMIGVYIFVCGAFFGSILTGVLADAIGRQAAIAIVVLPSTLIGGALIAYGARYIRRDISMVVEELTEERDEMRRIAEKGAEVPVIQVRNLDFSYGKVQVLFDIDLDVHRGETLALLGTNGAGKSTLLRVISGLGVAERGVVRLNGRTVTYADPELRVKTGIVQLKGGGATFGPLTVRENLEMAGFVVERDRVGARIDRALDLFPALRDRVKSPAGGLSGGQQQMLALAMALVHEPEVLIIDELSLGLAPVVLQQVLDVVHTLHDEGQTMIVVEQSINVALSIADRAVFMEKGEIKFEGPAQELAERGDLVRAVFLGS